MYFLLFGFWILLNGQWTTEIAVVGAIVCAALYAFMTAFLGYSPRREWKLACRAGRIAGYFFYLLKEIFLSALQVIRLVWSPGLEVQPELFAFRTRAHTRAGKVVLANSITMTPGTITVSIQKDHLLVHCLDNTFNMGKDGFEMENRVMKLEGKHRDAKEENSHD